MEAVFEKQRIRSGRGGQVDLGSRNFRSRLPSTSSSICMPNRSTRDKSCGRLVASSSIATNLVVVADKEPTKFLLVQSLKSCSSVELKKLFTADSFSESPPRCLLQSSSQRLCSALRSLPQVSAY